MPVLTRLSQASRPARRRRAASAGTGCRAAEGLGIAGADEAVLALIGARGLERAAFEDPLRRRGERVAGGDQAHLAAEEALQHRRHQRVVRAAEDHRVDLGAAQRRAVGAHLLDHGLGERKPALDDRREVGRGHLGHGELAMGARERPQVGAAVDGGRGREHPDSTRVGDRGGDLGLGLDHGDDVDPALGGDLAGGVDPRPGGRVAGDHDQLRAALEQEAGVALDAPSQLLGALRAVGKTGIVAEVDVVLLGQRDQALVQHGQAADAGVEDRDRQRRVGHGLGHPLR